MFYDSTFFKNAGINPGIAADLSFVVMDGKSQQIIDKHKSFIPHNKSVGSIQTLLEMHTLMYKSLSLINPGLVFTPDFPDYLLAHDDPNYVTPTDPKYIEIIPTLDGDEYKSMPHYRNDLYQRNYEDFKKLEKVPAPTITWGCVRSEPGTVSGTPFRGTQELKPRERELVLVFNKSDLSILQEHSDNQYVEHQDKIYKYIKVKGQFLDNLVQYNIWTRTTWEAEELIEWFQNDYMLPYTGMFREAGINELIFQRRIRDDTLMQRKNGFHLRSILYYIRTEHILNETIMPINRVDVDVNVMTSTADLVINKQLSDYYDNILDRWQLNK
jgi:hypothetical protein